MDEDGAAADEHDVKKTTDPGPPVCVLETLWFWDICSFWAEHEPFFEEHVNNVCDDFTPGAGKYVDVARVVEVRGKASGDTNSVFTGEETHDATDENVMKVAAFDATDAFTD